jgi:hypothetical protein
MMREDGIRILEIKESSITWNVCRKEEEVSLRLRKKHPLLIDILKTGFISPN